MIRYTWIITKGGLVGLCLVVVRTALEVARYG